MGWGSQFYDQCVGEQDPAFADVYYKNNIAQRVTMLSLYMAYGGTSWGHSAAPVVYTSYDYSAPLRETREIQDKFKQIKLLALFTRVSKDLLKTDMEDFGEGRAVDNRAVYTWILRNPDTQAGFYTLQQTDSASRKRKITTASLKTSVGLIKVDSIVLDGRQSKILTTDYRIGNMTLLYSTADILTYGIFDSTILVMYLKEGQQGEFGLSEKDVAEFKIHGADVKLVGTKEQSSTGKSFTRYRWTQPKGKVVVKFSNNFTVLLLDVQTAWTFFAPTLTSDPNIEARTHFFVLGPYLVRDASFIESEIRISGDWNEETELEVFGGRGRTQIVWNGKHLQSSPTEYGSIKARLPSIQHRSVQLPELTEWYTADSLPERHYDYDDSRWTVCNKTSNSQYAPKSRNIPVLHSSDYGFHSGIKIYRGYFDGLPQEVRLTVQGGLASGWSAWFNRGYYVNSSIGDPKASSTTLQTRISPEGGGYNTRSNVLTVVTDYTGHDEANARPAGPMNPRGILEAKLFDGDKQMNFAHWKIQGNAGGETELDAVRGPMNEGGLYGERLGWHLPGLDIPWTLFQPGTPQMGIDKPGIAWYITKFDLNIDADLDVPLGLEVDAPAGTVARVQIFINGYNYGKYMPHIGPQTRFPFQPGLINTRGSNMLAISLWAQAATGAKLSTVRLIKFGTYATGFNMSQDWGYLQPGWRELRGN
jgi:Beta-galactosidase, domain 2/Beta-galactosidase jelly roll domain/Beta-galactosidase, domain 3/Glycosyl hydrolases family 35